MKALSLFSNVGIAETYLNDLGIKTAVANELIVERAEFFEHLYPETKMIRGDISQKAVFNEVIEESKNNKVDLILATPPCQGMSIAGDMNPYDERNSLIKYVMQAAKILKPSYIFIENVTQQLTTPIVHEGKELLIPQYIEKCLGKEYRINEENVINTVDYEIPQNRKRAIFLLARKDTGINWEFPKKHAKIVTLKELFKDIPDLWPCIKEKEYRKRLPENTDSALKFHKWHKPPSHVWRNVECMLYTPTGNTAFDNKIHFPKKSDGKRIKGYDTTYHRMFWDKPAPTVTRYNGIMGSQNNVHPGKPWKKDAKGDMMYTNPRVLSIYELLLVSSLPENWNIPDWASENLIRHAIGEGIPPKLIYQLMSTIVGKGGRVEYGK